MGGAREEQDAVFLRRGIGNLQRKGDVAGFSGQVGDERTVAEEHEWLGPRVEQAGLHRRVDAVVADADHRRREARDQFVEERIADGLEGKDLVEPAHEKPLAEAALRTDDAAMPDRPGQKVLVTFAKQIAAALGPEPLVGQITVERLRKTPPRWIAEDCPVRPGVAAGLPQRAERVAEEDPIADGVEADEEDAHGEQWLVVRDRCLPAAAREEGEGVKWFSGRCAAYVAASPPK